MRRRLTTFSVAALLALNAAPVLAARIADLPPPDAYTQAKGGMEYHIGPQDVLDISVSQVEELSKPVTVDTSGKILLPLVGQIPAAGRTPAELSGDIATALKKNYMKDPQVVVSLKESQLQKVTVDGAVIQPGVYPLPGHADAGGLPGQGRGPQVRQPQAGGDLPHGQRGAPQRLLRFGADPLGPRP
jgi:polysaccharide export outer membrane protein